jgi:hypothetical protein
MRVIDEVIAVVDAARIGDQFGWGSGPSPAGPAGVL